MIVSVVLSMLLLDVSLAAVFQLANGVIDWDVETPALLGQLRKRGNKDDDNKNKNNNNKVRREFALPRVARSPFLFLFLFFFFFL
jgi:hypothetical protein